MMSEKQEEVFELQSVRKHVDSASAPGAIEDSKLIYDMILEVGEVGFWDWDIETNGVVYSDQWKRQLGFEPDELKDAYETWTRLMLPEDLAEAKSMLHAHLEYGVAFEHVARFRTKSGAIVFMLTRARALRDASGRPYRMVGLQMDVTELRRHQEIANEERERAFHSARLAALGKMAGGVAHEINNPLTILKGMAELAASELGREPFDKDQVMAWMGKISSTAERVARIVRTMRNLTRSADGAEISEISLESVVSDVTELSRQRLIDHGVSLSFISLESGVLCAGVETQIAQIVLNLVSNALDAQRPARGAKASGLGWITIEVLASQTFVDLRVANGGPRIAGDVAERAMEPFFTTKTAGEGTGLGLSISHSLARQMGGDLFIDLGAADTTFVLRLLRW